MGDERRSPSLPVRGRLPPCRFLPSTSLIFSRARRFAEGAAAIDGRVLRRMEAVGKNLFAFFGDSSPSSPGGGDDVVVHVHFGMSGAWAVFSADSEPEVRATTRLRLEEIAGPGRVDGGGLAAHLSAMTVQHGGPDLYASKKGALGEDPLRPDADPAALYSRVLKSKSRKSIGQLVMDQTFFAGPGNIYRAEILFLAGVHPSTPGNALSKDEFDRVWDFSVRLLRRGYDTGSILTVDADLDPAAAAKGERRYIYNRSECARCGGGVSSWDMSGRTCYACEGGCQPRHQQETAVESKQERAKPDAVASRGPEQQQQQQHVPFISHCAPVGRLRRLEEGGPESLTIREIRDVIVQMAGEDALPPKSARKAVQVEALRSLLPTPKNDASGSGKATAMLPLPPPRISAEDAAREKAASGENRAVEHVAELSRDQAVRAVAAVTPSPGKKRPPSSRPRRGGEVSRRKSPRKL